MMFLTTNICSLQGHPVRNPACSSLSLLFTSDRSQFNKKEQKTFPGMESNVMPLQLCIIEIPHFLQFHNGTRPQSSGTSSACHIRLKRQVSSSTTVCPQCLCPITRGNFTVKREHLRY